MRKIDRNFLLQLVALVVFLIAMAAANRVPLGQAAAAVFFLAGFILGPGFLLSSLFRAQSSSVVTGVGCAVICGLTAQVVTFFSFSFSGTYLCLFIPLLCYLLLLRQVTRERARTFFEKLADALGAMSATHFFCYIVAGLAYTFFVRTIPYRDVKSLGLDMHVLGAASQLVSLRYGFPMQFMTIAGDYAAIAYNSFGHMVGVLFTALFHSSALLYVSKIHYIIFGSLTIISSLVAIVSFIEKKFVAYAFFLVGCILIWNIYFVQMAAMPLFLLIVALFLNKNNTSWGLIVISWCAFFVLFGARFFASIPLLAGMTMSCVITLLTHNERIVSLRHMAAAYSATAVAYWLFVKFGIQSSQYTPLEVRFDHVPQLFSDVRHA
ncbi:hypothetical protein LJC15_01620, partial [Desulfovibrio sp. OttesenSCG-928-G11]|nr:hypothetical protein [Desulfovibrio sp. OttesenSCG-928-G11]